MTHRRLGVLVAGRAWWKVLAIGAVAWLGAGATAVATRDPLLVPGALVTGSLLVPFTSLVALAEYGRIRRGSPLTTLRLVLGFAAGAALAVWGAAAIEHVVLGWAPDLYFTTVAVSEELAKLAVVWLVAAGLAAYARRDGMLLGAAVGLGFAAYESLGYAVMSLERQGDGGGLVAAVQAQLDRGLLAPIGHGLWTALVAGALFAGSRTGRLRPSWTLAGWFAAAVGLHVAWDASAGLAVLLVAWLADASATLDDFRLGRLPGLAPSARALLVGLMTAVQAGIVVVGLLLARSQWRRG